MLRSLYTAATGMQAQELTMDTIANNLANANTTGYKKVRADFEDLYSQTLRGVGQEDSRSPAAPQPVQVGLGVQTQATTRYQTEGVLTNTQNPTDLAIQGSGFFRIQRTDGTYAYTRAGNFSVSATGQLVTQGGLLVNPAITIPAQTTQLTVGTDGTVQATVAGRQNSTQLGTSRLSPPSSTPRACLMPGTISSRKSRQPAARDGKGGRAGKWTESPRVTLESSNVSAVTEMIDMITAQRSYEISSQVIQAADQMLQKLETVGQSA